MRGNILYERSTTIPNIRGHFRRPRIDKLLKELLNRQLIIITAGAGCGKTHAVSSFLNNAPVRTIWIQLSQLDNHLERFWEKFLYIMEFQNKETANSVRKLGFPDTYAKFDIFLHIIAKDIYSREHAVLVFDDFHLITDESILGFIENIIYAKMENFCIILNCRKKLSYNITNMLINELAGQITAEDLHFTPEETEGYLKQNGISLPAAEREKVQSFTGGWPLALYLVGLSIKKGGIVLQNPAAGAIPLIFEMIEKESFSEYDPAVQKFMIKVSLLNSLPEALVGELAGENYNAVIEVLNNCMFLYYNPYTKHYDFHHLFLEFLNEKHKLLTQQEITDTHLKAAEWYKKNENKIEALAYYEKCGRYDEILNIIFGFGVATFTRATAEFYIDLIDKIPDELMENAPLLHVHHAGLLCNNAKILPAVNELIQTQRKLEALPLTKENKAVLGEIYCMLGLVYLGMANYEFVKLFKKADEYLPNGSAMFDSNGVAVNTRYAIMLSSPEEGELKRMEDAMFDAMPFASKTMNGYGQGLEYLASAEAAFFTGDIKKASINAYEAVYRAREKNIADIVSGGFFLLMRIEAANGNYKGVVSNLEQMKNFINSTENKSNFNGMPDVAEGWFNLMLGNTDKVAHWLVDDTVSSSVLAPYSMGMERIIKARYFLKEGRYHELLAWLGQSEKPIRQYNIWLILLDILICKSIASHYIQDEAQTVAALREAYEISHKNNIIMQFAEFGSVIQTVIYNVRRSKENTIPEAWLDEIYTKSSTYDKHIRNINAQHLQTPEAVTKPLIKLTKRESEILGYLCHGLTNVDIAVTCFITVSAVKKALNNIYIKLGATNRADAVRIALQKGILTL